MGVLEGVFLGAGSIECNTDWLIKYIAGSIIALDCSKITRMNGYIDDASTLLIGQ